MKSGWNLVRRNALIPYRLKAQDWDRLLRSKMWRGELDEKTQKALFVDESADELLGSNTFVQIIGEDEKWFLRFFKDSSFFRVLWKRKKLLLLRSLSGSSPLAYNKKHRRVVRFAGTNLYSYAPDGSDEILIATVGANIADTTVATMDDYIYAYFKDLDTGVYKLQKYDFGGTLVAELQPNNAFAVPVLKSGSGFLWLVPFDADSYPVVRFSYDLTSETLIYGFSTAAAPSPTAGTVVYAYNVLDATPQYALLDYPNSFQVELPTRARDVLVDSDGYIYVTLGSSIRKYDSAGNLIWETPLAGATALTFLGRMLLVTYVTSGSYRAQALLTPDGEVLETAVFGEGYYLGFRFEYMLPTPEGYIWIVSLAGQTTIYGIDLFGHMFNSSLNLSSLPPYWDY